MSKKLLIIAPYQFGELSDCYYWAKYAVLEGYDVTYIGYKYKNRKVKERSYPGVKVKSVNHYSNRFLLGLFFYIRCIGEILFHNQQNVIICRMPLCQVLAKLFPSRNIILDVRTLSVSSNKTVRERQDGILKVLKGKFKKCSVISEGVGKYLGEPYSILPLGAEPLSATSKEFKDLNLFYIGTFDNRNLSVFIEGLSLFQKKTGLNCTFDVVGGGTEKEEKLIHSVISETGVKNVNLHGYLTHEEAKSLFDKCNVGVCFVPITDYYQNQPPTKLYEYLLSGMAVIATATTSNVAVVTNNNGVLIDDNVESVCNGLIEIVNNFCYYDSSLITGSSGSYHWSNIVKTNLLTLMK